MPISPNSAAQLKTYQGLDPNDPIEQILARHGVPPTTRLARKEGYRASAAIDEIIADVRRHNAKETH